MKRSLIVVAAVLFFLISVGLAQAPNVQQSSISFTAPWGATVVGVPGGEAVLLSESGIDIVVTLKDSAGNPVVGYPAEDIRMYYTNVSDQAGLSNCFWQGDYWFTGIQAVSDTDSNGEATIDGYWDFGGNRYQYQPYIWIEVDGSPFFEGPPVQFNMISPDLNENLDVGLSDTVIFSPMYSSGNYHWQIDFQPDGQIDLGDLVIYAGASGSTCQ